MQVMIDLETLGTQQDAVILTMGVQMFDLSSEYIWPEGEITDPVTKNRIPCAINIKIDVDQQLSIGRTVDENTIEWWSKQTSEAQQEAFDPCDRIPLPQALQILSDMIAAGSGPQKKSVVWSKGPTFDIVMLEHAYKQAGLRTPWVYWNVRDARTVYSLCPNIDVRANGPISHRALDDCRQQINILHKCYQQLGLLA